MRYNLYMTADELIAKGEELKQLPYDDSDQDLWDKDVGNFAKQYGAYDIAYRALFPNTMSYSDDDSNRLRYECIVKAQKLLKSLESRPLNKDDDANEMAPSFEQAKHRVQEKVTKVNNTFNINAPTTFGENSPINQITIGEFLAGLEQEIKEKVTDEPTKKKLLSSIKEITSNPSFVAIAPIAASEIMKKLMGA